MMDLIPAHIKRMFSNSCPACGCGATIKITHSLITKMPFYQAYCTTSCHRMVQASTIEALAAEWEEVTSTHQMD